MGHDRHGIDLATDARDHPAVFAAAFNSWNPQLLEQVYVEDAIFVTPQGERVVGDERVRANIEFQSLGIPIQVRPRHVHEYRDLALLIVDWTIEGKDPAGQDVKIGGTATDLAQRGADGFWRYLIDVPFGTETQPGPTTD
jgi:ketosteroid isomerase-like protein